MVSFDQTCPRKWCTGYETGHDPPRPIAMDVTSLAHFRTPSGRHPAGELCAEGDHALSHFGPHAVTLWHAAEKLTWPMAWLVRSRA